MLRVKQIYFWGNLEISFYDTLLNLGLCVLCTLCTEWTVFLIPCVLWYNRWGYGVSDCITCTLSTLVYCSVVFTKRIEYILEWNLENTSVCILSVPFSLKGNSKCTNHVNVHKLYAVEYINTVCSLDFIKWIRGIKNIVDL